MKLELLRNIIIGFSSLLAFLLGGFDLILIALIIIMFCDWVTGVLKAIKKHNFSYALGLWGVVNKVVSLIIIITVNFIQIGLNIELPIRETIISMLLINEGLSVVSNASSFVSGLEPLAKYFANIKINIFKIFTIGGDKID